MGESKFTLDPFSGHTLDISFLREVSELSKTRGAQIGVPWTKEVYEYLFEHADAEEVERIFYEIWRGYNEGSDKE